ncbi:quinol:cytochrome c oxidoreductase pentaheme cytochrome subunit [Christiangramia gaetbulicola]|uniref:Quinol:cytochrome c oxidoreductase pentaheme cytochrome subunit n=1 Tax=Christiangramia gaetbulicola TaxID=703340 RepID=A0A2T6AKW0_9FLAO|nr:c-type cytochrome [Christiangramia gaetbulicola]PTX44461.1 quinol:cytochrome c oxidoreductase pentaheme cytochrome subunit [Christiangramia gaetbulicola]
MKKVIFRHSTSRQLLLSVAFLLTFTLSGFSQAQAAQDATAQAEPEQEAAAADTGGSDLGDPAAGKELFNSLCAACHKPYSNSIGPALHGVTDRRDMDWIHEWVKNSAALIASGDAQANEIYNEWGQTAMPAFPQLSNGDIDNILAYVEQPKPEPQAAAGSAGGEAGAAGGSGGVSTDVILGILVFVLAMLLLVLFLVNKTLRTFADASGIVIPEKPKRKPIYKAFVENQFLVLVSSIIVLLAVGYFAYGFLMQVGVDKGYQPIQPIHYSHRIHAGDNQIECKYCHSSARTSKHSGIPSLNVCMNCHKAIAEVAPETATEEYSKEFYDKEIAKLYDATGWDPATRTYSGEEKPVKWVRIHNLPDFAYFNHSQHVSVAGIECQKCHGPIQEMEIVYQDAPLTMGWCINCHRETNIRIEGNEYYEKIHEELSKKYGVEELTAAQMGGLECGKCHY